MNLKAAAAAAEAKKGKASKEPSAMKTPLGKTPTTQKPPTTIPQKFKNNELCQLQAANAALEKQLRLCKTQKGALERRVAELSALDVLLCRTRKGPRDSGGQRSDNLKRAKTRHIKLHTAALEKTTGDGNVSFDDVLVGMLKARAVQNPSLLGTIQDAVGTGRTAQADVDEASGKVVWKKSKAMDLDKLEQFLLPTRGHKIHNQLLSEMGLSDSTKAYRMHILSRYVLENAPVRPLIEDNGRSFETDLDVLRSKFLEHEEYAPRLKFAGAVNQQGGARRLLELISKDGTNEQRRQLEIMLVLVSWPQLRRADGSSSSASRSFRVPIFMGRVKEKKDIIFPYFQKWDNYFKHKTVTSRLLGCGISVDWVQSDDYKSLALDINKKHTASNYPCITCTKHKQDLKYRSWIPAEKAKMKHRCLPRSIARQEGCSHEVEKGSCSCIIVAAERLEKLYGSGNPSIITDADGNSSLLPTHHQSHPRKKDIDKYSDKYLYGIVGYPLWPHLEIWRRMYGVWHACQNCRVVMITIIKCAAAELKATATMKAVVSIKPIDLPHWKVHQYFQVAVFISYLIAGC